MTTPVLTFGSYSCKKYRFIAPIDINVFKMNENLYF